MSDVPSRARSTDPAATRIVLLDTPRGCRDHVYLQDLVWGFDPPEAVPVHLLVAVAHNGGVVLGAYDGDEIVDALLGLPALHDGHLAHLSHQLAVHPAYRHRGVGAALKWRQRNLVLAQGIDAIIWTFDPLQARNARLNLSWLGAEVRHDVRDYYGPMNDGRLNAGLPSNRLMVTWALDTPRVRERAAATEGAPPRALHSCLAPRRARPPARRTCVSPRPSRCRPPGTRPAWCSSRSLSISGP